MGAEKIQAEVKTVGSKVLKYEDVPKYRRNWCAILMFLIFPPGFLYVILSGDVYYERKGELKTYSKLAKIFLAIWSCGYMLKAILK